jgi:hypothetical protein
MHPEIAKTLVEQHRQELMQHSAQSRPKFTDSAGPSWLSRHLPRWHVSWSRTRLAPAVGGPDRAGLRGSSVVIIISAHRSA